MRLSILELRNLINIVLSETPLADLYPMQRSKLPDVDDFRANHRVINSKKGAEQTIDNLKNVERGVEKYFSTSNFATNALHYFRLLSVPVYLIPLNNIDYFSNDRTKLVVNPGKALSRMGLKPDDVAKLTTALDDGACVLVASVSHLEKGFLPSPWMIIHAMFDGETPLLRSVRLKIINILKSISKLTMSAQVRNHNVDLFQKALTMKSARDETITFSDTPSEIMTQAILTSRGFIYNETGDQTIDLALKKIVEIVQGIRQQFESEIRGKMFVIEVMHLTD